jgi:hypothetical protein
MSGVGLAPEGAGEAVAEGVAVMAPEGVGDADADAEGAAVGGGPELAI